MPGIPVYNTYFNKIDEYSNLIFKFYSGEKEMHIQQIWNSYVNEFKIVVLIFVIKLIINYSSKYLILFEISPIFSLNLNIKIY